MEMRQHALGQAREAFAEGREEIYSAMEVIYEIVEYAKKEGLLALSKDEFFRREGEPYILDAIEEKGKKVPLKEYLAYGIDRVSYGDEFELLNVFMENRYFANAYSGKDAFISYIYLVGVIAAIARGLAFETILAYYRSFIPDEEEEAFDKFASRWESKIDKKKMKALGRVVPFDKDKQ